MIAAGSPRWDRRRRSVLWRQLRYVDDDDEDDECWRQRCDDESGGRWWRTERVRWRARPPTLDDEIAGSKSRCGAGMRRSRTGRADEGLPDNTCPFSQLYALLDTDLLRRLSSESPKEGATQDGERWAMSWYTAAVNSPDYRQARSTDVTSLTSSCTDVVESCGVCEERQRISSTKQWTSHGCFEHYSRRRCRQQQRLVACYRKGN